MSSTGTRRAQGGFTLVELIISAAISAMVIAGTLSLFLYCMRAWYEESIKNELNINLEVAAGHIRRDLRLSSTSLGGSMAFFPANSNVYTAISLPLALDADGDNLLERDENGKIIWDQTVIYHVRPGTPDELVRTVFAPKNTNATPDQIYNQLVAVVGGATTNAALSGESYSSRVIFENLVTMSFRPIPTAYDGYSPVQTIEPGFNFGSVILTPGNHTIKLSCAGKNTASSGYKLGIDGYNCTASSSYRDGEFYLTTNYYTYFTYSNSPGATLQTETFTGVTGLLWNGGQQLLFTPADAGGWLALNAYNDLWLDTVFAEPGGSWLDNTSVKSNDYVSMDKGLIWEADSLTAAQTNESTTADYRNATVDVYFYGEYRDTTPSLSQLYRDGRYVRVKFYGPEAAATNQTLKISNVTFAKVPAGPSYALNFSDAAGNPGITVTLAGAEVEIEAGRSVWCNWFDAEIDKGATYYVRFTVANDINKDCMSYWPASTTQSFVNTVPTTNVLAVWAVEARHPRFGYFRSGPFDTFMSDPPWNKMKFLDYQPNYANGEWAGDVDVRVRSSDSKGMTNAWTAYYQSGNNNSISSLTRGRYVQFEGIFEARIPSTYGTDVFDQSAILYDVCIDWPGPTGIVTLNMDLGKGPDYGIYTASVDGRTLARGIEIDMTIFKTLGLTAHEMQAHGIMQVIPLNTGK